VAGPGTITGAETGIGQGRGRIEVTGVDLVANGVGLFATKGTVTDVTATDNGSAGLRGDTLILERVSVSGSEVGVSVTKKVVATDVDAVGAGTHVVRPQGVAAAVLDPGAEEGVVAQRLRSSIPR
jgi:hypothetical protein